MQKTANHEGFLRLRQVLTLIPVARTTWYNGIQRGIYPAPVRLSERTSAWRASDIQELIERLGQGGAAL